MFKHSLKIIISTQALAEIITKDFLILCEILKNHQCAFRHGTLPANPFAALESGFTLSDLDQKNLERRLPRAEEDCKKNSTMDAIAAALQFLTKDIPALRGLWEHKISHSEAGENELLPPSFTLTLGVDHDPFEGNYTIKDISTIRQEHRGLPKGISVLTVLIEFQKFFERHIAELRLDRTIKIPPPYSVRPGFYIELETSLHAAVTSLQHGSWQIDVRVKMPMNKSAHTAYQHLLAFYKDILGGKIMPIQPLGFLPEDALRQFAETLTNH